MVDTIETGKKVLYFHSKIAKDIATFNTAKITTSVLLIMFNITPRSFLHKRNDKKKKLTYADV